MNQVSVGNSTSKCQASFLTMGPVTVIEQNRERESGVHESFTGS